jgi:hypothetical protein
MDHKNKDPPLWFLAALFVGTLAGVAILALAFTSF